MKKYKSVNVSDETWVELMDLRNELRLPLTKVVPLLIKNYYLVITQNYHKNCLYTFVCA